MEREREREKERYIYIYMIIYVYIHICSISKVDCYPVLILYGVPLEKDDCSQVLDRTGMISISKKLCKGNPERPY